jgi:hypothetical protein
MRRRFLSVRLSPEEKVRVDGLARQWGCPKADVLRWVFRFFLMGGKEHVFLNHKRQPLEPEA